MSADRGQKRRSTPDAGVGADGAPSAKHPTPRSTKPEIDYKKLIELAPDAILVVDSDGHYIAANKVACEMTGYTEREICELQIGDLTAPQERTFSLEHFDLLRQIGRTRSDRLLRRKDGTTVIVETHASDVKDGTCMAILRDVSQRINEQEALQRSLDAYSTLVNICNAAVISAGADGRIRSWNPAAESLFGYTFAEAIGMPIKKLVAPELRDAHVRAYGARRQRPEEDPFERTLHGNGLRADGTLVPLEISVAVGTEGAERVFTAIVRDITEHLSVVEKLNDALQRLQFHVQRMPLAYLVWDTQFRVVEWNPAAERIFGYSREEAIGKTALDLIVPPDVTATVEKIWAGLCAGTAGTHSINENVRKDGSRLTCEWFSTPLHDSGGNFRGVASMAQDVSERAAIEARIRDAQKLESLGVLASGVAHDFNSSLMVILGNTALLRSTKSLPPKALEHIKLIEEAGSRAESLIKHLLAYARTGRHNPQSTDLNEVINESLTFIRSTFGREHTLDVQLTDGLARITADRSQIEQVILNLCQNAMQAMPRGGTVRVQTRETQLTVELASVSVLYDAKPGRYVELRVSDDGCGMDKATRSRIFDPFFTTSPQGHGLGLPAVLGILRQHSATVIVDTKPGTGTQMRVFFPVEA